MFHLSLLKNKSVDLAVAHDGCIGISPYFFILATLITKVLFKQSFIIPPCNGLNIADNKM